MAVSRFCPEPQGVTVRPVGGTVLRGASVSADARKVARVAALVGLGGLAVLVAALFWAGIRHNSQITRLRDEGRPVTATVSQCRGLMGGSGSNLVGYECTGTFTMNGHRHDGILPGSSLRAAGSTVRLVSVLGDPSLLATPAAVATEHPSGTVFLLPAALLAILVALLSACAVGARRSAAYSARWIPA